MNITTHGGTTDASDKQPGVVTIGSKDLLDSLVELYLNRAKMCEESARKLADCGNYADAFAAETRRGVWIYAAEMVKQERLPASLASASGYDSLREIEEKILREANTEFFKIPQAVGHRITRLQALCVIRAWMRNTMPGLEDES